MLLSGLSQYSLRTQVLVPANVELVFKLQKYQENFGVKFT